jgi:sec-independent protein translocase protein TatC
MVRTLRRALGSVGHEERLSTVGHLDELRTRLILSLVVLSAAFGVCFSQSHRLLGLIDAPLARQTQAQVRAGEGPLGATYTVAQAARDVAIQLHVVVGVLRRGDGGTPPAVRSALGAVSEGLERDIGRLSAPARGDKPVTLGIGEPFTTTVTISFVFALILTLPLLLHQAYAFLAPALEPADRRRIRPIALAIPFLFVAGVLFGYFVVMPAAVHFLLNFNSAQFNALVQAGPYYKFAATTVLAMGLVFEVPVAIVAVTRLGLVTPRRLRKSRRYAVAACGLVAAALPGDAVTMLLETVPLYLLFELGILVASVADRRARARAASVTLSSAQ